MQRRQRLQICHALSQHTGRTLSQDEVLLEEIGFEFLLSGLRSSPEHMTVMQGHQPALFRFTSGHVPLPPLHTPVSRSYLIPIDSLATPTRQCARAVIHFRGMQVGISPSQLSAPVEKDKWVTGTALTFNDVHRAKERLKPENHDGEKGETTHAQCYEHKCEKVTRRR